MENATAPEFNSAKPNSKPNATPKPPNEKSANCSSQASKKAPAQSATAVEKVKKDYHKKKYCSMRQAT